MPDSTTCAPRAASLNPILTLSPLQNVTSLIETVQRSYPDTAALVAGAEDARDPEIVNRFAVAMIKRLRAQNDILRVLEQSVRVCAPSWGCHPLPCPMPSIDVRAQPQCRASVPALCAHPRGFEGRGHPHGGGLSGGSESFRSQGRPLRLEVHTARRREHGVGADAWGCA